MRFIDAGVARIDTSKAELIVLWVHAGRAVFYTRILAADEEIVGLAGCARRP